MGRHRRRMRPNLGTYIDIGVNVEAGDHAINRAFQTIDQVQKLLSRHDQASELSRLNQSSGEEIVLHPISVAVLRLARFVARASGGLFHTGAEKLELSKNRACLTGQFKITLDGIAKGYAVDLAIRELRSSGATEGWVNAGGDLKVFGNLTLPIHRREREGFKVIGGLRNAAVATSAISEDSSFMSHIESSDGVTPLAGDWTVLAKNAWLADALTKVAALSAPLERAETVAQLGGLLLASEEV